MCECPMDMDNGVGIDYGNRGQAWCRRVKGKNWDNCNRVNKNERKKKYYVNLKVKGQSERQEALI